MDKQVLEMLGLFTVPRDIKIKDREERALDTKLMNEARDFFGDSNPNSKGTDASSGNADASQDVNMFVDQKDAKKQKDLEK